MTVDKNRTNHLLNELSEALKFNNEEERIELKASLIQMDILTEIKKLMREKGITNKDLADALKKSPSFVSQLFSGDKLLNLKTIARFEEIFGVKFRFSFENEKTYGNGKYYYSRPKTNYSRVSEK